MQQRSSTETEPVEQEKTLEQRKRETVRKKKKKAASNIQQSAEKEGLERVVGRRKKHPISLRPTNEIYELSETMANQRGKDRTAQDHNAHAIGLIIEAVSGPAVDGRFGTLSPEDLDERAIPLYIALGGYLKRRGKLPRVFGEGDHHPTLREEEWRPSRNGQNDTESWSVQNMQVALDEEAETAFSGGPGPS